MTTSNPNGPSRRTPQKSASELRKRNFLRDFWIVWLVPIVLLIVATFAFNVWGTGGGPSGAAQTIHAVRASYFDVHPKDNRTHVVRTGRFETKASHWDYFWMYNCGFALHSGWRVHLQVIRLTSGGSNRSSTGTSVSSVDITGGHGNSSASSVRNETGAGRYQFDITASRSCIWQLRAPAGQPSVKGLF